MQPSTAVKILGTLRWIGTVALLAALGVSVLPHLHGASVQRTDCRPSAVSAARGESCQPHWM